MDSVTEVYKFFVTTYGRPAKLPRQQLISIVEEENEILVAQIDQLEQLEKDAFIVLLFRDILIVILI
jgi:hypothetical protein